MKILEGSLVLCLLAACAFVAGWLYVGNAAQQTQGRERIIKKINTERDEPIDIAEIKVNGQVVSFGKKFEGDDDWLKGLVVSVQNRFYKRILLVNIGLRFPRPPDSQEKISVTQIFHGNEELLTRPPSQEERLVGIAPGQTVELVVSPAEFDSIRRFLAGTGYPPSIERLDLMINSVIFEDDTMWNGGSILRRDQKEPGRWSVEPSSSAKMVRPKFLISKKSPLSSGNGS